MSDDMLGNLSRVLNLPRQFFVQSDQVYGLGTHAYVYRKRQKISAQQRKRIEAQVNLLRMHTDQMLRSVDIQSPHRIPQLATTEKYVSRKTLQLRSGLNG